MEEQGQLPFFNNPNTDRTRAKNPMPAPDSDGLFDFLGVSCWPIGADSRREAVEVSRRHHQPARRHLR
jgi:hypothetical protein